MPQAAPLSVADVLRSPGRHRRIAAQRGRIAAPRGELCRKALDELVASRTREGAKLAAAVAERIAGMRRRLEQVTPLVPQAIAAYQARLQSGCARRWARPMMTPGPRRIGGIRDQGGRGRRASRGCVRTWTKWSAR